METSKEKVIEYYEEATKDYEFWSKNYNMHFGLTRWNIFNREKMLQKMNKEVLNNANMIDNNGHFLDVGCGCGATLRQGCKLNSSSNFTGVTLSKWQVEKGMSLMNQEGINNGVLETQDYHKLNFANTSFNGAYALESICHSNNRLKVLKEVSRVLKPQSKFVIADGFIKVNPNNTNAIFKRSYKMLCNGWALPNLPNIYELNNQLGLVGFVIDEVKDISWQIAPSVFHSPMVIMKYLLFAAFGKAPLKKQNINNLKGSFVALFMGLQRSKFSYYMITCTKQ